METYESIVEIKHGSTVLVALGDPMWTPVSIDGQQLVDVITRVRAAGAMSVPRGNERHTLTFEKCDEQGSVADAFKGQLAWAASVPRTMATVTITFDDETAYTIANATVESWSGGQVEQLGRHGLRITGGRLVAL